MKAPNGEVLLEVKNLRKFFPIRRGFLQKVVGNVRAVDDVTFYINRGETLSLVGESGCGKTTTSRCILRAIDPTSGQILFHQEDGTRDRCGRAARKQDATAAPQDADDFSRPLFFAQPAHDPARHRRRAAAGERNERPPSSGWTRVTELLRLVGLRPEYMQRFPHAFSGGQRQRIGIARALALNPQPDRGR